MGQERGVPCVCYFIMVILKQSVVNAIVKESKKSLPNECCGLLAGSENVLTQIHVVSNVHPMPAHNFSMDPICLLRELKSIPRNSLKWMGIFHSHPSTDAIPSKSDISNSISLLSPNILYLIYSLPFKQMHLYIFQGRAFDEICFQVEN